MNKFLVYRITNKINGKLYFGITKVSINKRWIQHKCNSTRKTYHLYRAIVKYGFENFIIEIIKRCTSEAEMYSLEVELIKKYNSNDPLYGYNHSCGGEISSRGSKRTPEQKKRISDYQKGRIRKPHTQETINKMKQLANGRDMTKAVSASAQKRRGVPASNRTPVFSLDENGIIVKYLSITEAFLKTGISITAISNNLANKSKTAGGLIWHYQQVN